MQTNEIAVILADQREEFEASDTGNLCPRVEEQQLSYISQMAQVVIGVRRCGKSTLCAKFLTDKQVDCAFVNFDDERFIGLGTEDLNKVLEAIYIVYGDVECMFFDEIQNVEGWPLFINRLLRQKKHLFLTGSNSKLLSNELITHLTGRHNKVELYPFSFREYCWMRQIDTESISTRASGLRQAALHDYLNRGGMPELLTEENRLVYVDGLFNAIVRNDIAKRFKVRHVDVLERMAKYLTDNYAQEYAPQTLASLFGVSNHTIDKYYSYLKEAFLLIGVQKFSFKARERICNEKYYVVDVTFASDRAGSFSLENLGWKLENVVCVELMRRYHHQYAEVFYYRDRSFEVDFVVAKDGTVLELIQVSYNIASEKTRRREIKGLVEGGKKFRCKCLTLITFSQEEEIETSGLTIHAVPATKWLTAERFF